MKILKALKEILDKLSRDNISGYASQSCFFIILSFFPFIMLLLTLIRFIPVKYDTLVSIIERMTPLQMHDFIDKSFTEIFEKSSFTLTSVTAVATLWAAGKGFMSLMQGFNTIYGIKETRNIIIQRFLACLYTVLFMFIILLSLVLMVFGNQLLLFISFKFPNTAFAVEAIMHLKNLIYPCILMVFFLCMYKFIPSRKTKFSREIPGAIVATVGWFIFSYSYSLYVNVAPNFSNMYGSLTTFVFALVWLYFCMNILFFGAEFNTFLERKIIQPEIFHRTHNSTHKLSKSIRRTPKK